MQHTNTVTAYHEPYPEPAIGTKEEAVKSALKAHRSIERIRKNSRATTVTGVALRDWFIWLLDVWYRSDQLPVHLKEVVRLYYLETDELDRQRTDEEVAQLMRTSLRSVKLWKRTAIGLIAEQIWP